MPGAKLGHAHILVRNVAESTRFYTEVLGLSVTEHRPGQWAFLTSGGAHHELALSEIGANAAGPDEDRVGLFHLGFDVEDEKEFAGIYRRLLERGVTTNPVDHRISWGVYFTDPDGNHLEVCLDRRGASDGTDLWEGENRPLTRERILAVLGRGS